MFKTANVIIIVFGTVLMSANLHAACTYNEAVMAFNNGNQIRGHALMKMAARDGDERAVHFLNSNGLASIARNSEQTATKQAGKALNFAVGNEADNIDASSRKSEQNS
ncbi:hypothetical protein [Kaarinaea lacus]